MTGRKKGVGSQILQDFPLEFLTHCYGHALNLAVSDMIRLKRLLRDTMDTSLTHIYKNRYKRYNSLNA